MFYSHFTLETRIELSLLLRTGVSKTDIAQELGKTRKSVHEEVKLNGNMDGSYHAKKTQRKTDQRRKKYT